VKHFDTQVGSFAVHRFYSSHKEYSRFTDPADARKETWRAKNEGCEAIVVYFAGRIVYQAIRKSGLGEIRSKLLREGLSLLQ
jgi:hypothetical protein